MNDSLDLRNLNKEPFVVNNQIYVLGTPVVSAQTLEQLIYALDQLGSEKPIIIINPQATTVPQFDQRLAELIQNNRRTQPHNQTTDDKYRFKDMTDADLQSIVEETCLKNPMLNKNNLFSMYQGLRTRAQALFNLDTLSKERDALWAAHCANPSSSEGSERYAELQYELIPQAQQVYDGVCQQLQSLDEVYAKQNKQTTQASQNDTHPTPITPVAATSSVPKTILHTQEDCAVVAAKEEVVETPENLQLSNTDTLADVTVHIWGPWTSIDYMQIPLSVAKNIASSPAYEGLRVQQRDVIFEDKAYKAVEPSYLIALGIDLIPDGLPVVYTDIGTFKRVGVSSEPMNNVKYWYPTPKQE